MNHKKILFLILFIGIVSCGKRNSDGTEKRIAEKIINHVIEKDSLKNYTYSGEVFFHIKSERLNDNNYKTIISLNGLESKSTEIRTERININGFETIIYFEQSELKYNLPEPFFVPDSKVWNFLAELIDDKIVLSKLKREKSIDKSEQEELDEIDF